MSDNKDRKFFVITPYSSMDPIGSPLSHHDSQSGQWEILGVFPDKAITEKITSASDDLIEVIKDICDDDPSTKWVYHSAENLMKHRFEGMLAYELVDHLMVIADNETPEEDVTDDHPVEEIRTAFIESGLYEASMPPAPATP